MSLRHVLCARQFERNFLETLFERAQEIESRLQWSWEREELKEIAKDKIAYLLFFEPSTRTRFSFATAAIHLGMNVVWAENALISSSAAKGEDLKDTVKTICGYNPDVIILRHPEAQASKISAEVSSVPIINAGDSKHPTQALIDAYTVNKHFGKIDDLVAILGGDVQHARTLHSLCYLLAKFKLKQIYFLHHPALKVPAEILSLLKNNRIDFDEAWHLEELIGKADFVYWTRIQREKYQSESLYEDVHSFYNIGPHHISLMKDDAIFMHPLPKTNEINPEIEKDPRVIYFMQAAYGIPVRMALLEWVLSKE